jgi:hypothetical protein
MEFFKFVNQNNGSVGSDCERCCLVVRLSSAVKSVYHQAVLELLSKLCHHNFQYRVLLISNIIGSYFHENRNIVLFCNIQGWQHQQMISFKLKNTTNFSWRVTQEVVSSVTFCEPDYFICTYICKLVFKITVLHPQDKSKIRYTLKSASCCTTWRIALRL